MNMILNLNQYRTCFMITLFFGLTYSFLPNHYVNFLSGNDYTHADITEIGILDAVAKYFEHHPPPGKAAISPGTLTGIPDITARKLYDRYYGGLVSERRFQMAIDDIIKHNNMVDKDHYNEAYWHCNGEQITEGHSKMQTLRDRLLFILNSSSPDYQTAREVIGQYLHILQMFYSNTNWIELYGGKIYNDLGITGKSLMQTSKEISVTCKSCSSKIGTNCLNNLEPIGETLTSGYKAGQDIPNSGNDINIVDNHESSESENHGKCSHGGPRGTSGTSSTATGGINKDTLNPTYSPHFTLHKTAAIAAIEHTKYFFVDPTNGLKALIGDEKFQNLLQLRPSKSFVFVIDTTRSVSDDVLSIINNTKEKVRERHQPYNYILVSSNGPDTVPNVQATKHEKEIIEWLNDKGNQDGHQCSEFSLAGIQTAAALADPTTKIYVFTDSPPKDLDRMNTITSLITEKRLQVEFVITDQCVSRSKRAITDTLQRSPVISPQKTILTPGTNLVLKKRIENEETNLVQIPVDATITELYIGIHGDQSMPYPLLQGPQGDPVYSNGKTVLQHLYYGNDMTYTIKNPEAGIWTIYRLDKNNWNIEVSCRSSIDFTYELVENDDTDELSQEQIVIIQLKSVSNVDVVERIVLTDDQGNDIVQSSLKSESNGVFKSRLQIQNQVFRIAIYGRDVFGNNFKRTKEVMNKHVQRRAAKSLRAARATPVFWKGINVYQQIAQTSGGNVYSVQKRNIGTAINVIGNSLISSEVTILRQVINYKVGTCDNFSFYIDDTVTEFTLRLNGEQGLPAPFIKDPNSKLIFPGRSANTTRQLIGGRLVVATFKSPVVGKWTFKKLDRYDWDMELTAQSPVDFTYKFLETGPGGVNQFEITGRPVAGRNTSVAVRVKEYAKVKSIDELVLMNKYGQIIANATLTQKQGSRTQGLYTGSLIMPDNEFQVAIMGIDKNSNPFQRLHTTLISTVGITLEKLPINGPFYTNERFIIPFRVTNIGSGYKTVDVDIADDQGFAQSPANLTFDIPGGANVTGSFVLTANTAGKTTTITISARTRGAKGTKFQYEIVRETTQTRATKKVDNFSPVCNVIKTTGSCSWDVCKCNYTQLETEAEVWDYGFGLKTITTSGAGSNAKFTHDQFSVGDIRNISGIVNIRLIVNCCRKDATITVTDVSGNQGECKIQVNKDYKKDGCKEVKEKSNTGNSNTAVIAGMGAGAGAVVIASVVTSVVIVKKKLAADSSTAVTPLT